MMTMMNEKNGVVFCYTIMLLYIYDTQNPKPKNLDACFYIIYNLFMLKVRTVLVAGANVRTLHGLSLPNTTLRHFSIFMHSDQYQSEELG